MMINIAAYQNNIVCHFLKLKNSVYDLYTIQNTSNGRFFFFFFFNVLLFIP